MSDHDTAPDPMDKAYAQAETMLDDEAARAARRARVLGAVAREAPAPAPVVFSPRKRRPAWAAGGWLMAAGVAGVSALVAVQLSTQQVVQPEPAPAETSAASAPAPAPTTAAPTTDAVPPAATQAPVESASQAEARPSRDVAPVVAAPAAESAPSTRSRPAPAPAPPPPAAFPSSDDAAPPPPTVAAPPPSARAASAESATAQTAPALSPMGQAAASASPTVRAARLRAAASAGRTAELRALLAEGTPVDAPDSQGETALMKAVQGNHPAAAALLRRQGASLDRRNRAGESAREMATAIDDPDLNRALGIAQ